MNGAPAPDCAKTMRNPSSTNTATIGSSQYFFSCRRNCHNSVSTRPLLMRSSVHSDVMPAVQVRGGIRPPSRPPIAAPREGVFPRQPPDDRERHQDHEKQQCEQHAGIDV